MSSTRSRRQKHKPFSSLDQLSQMPGITVGKYVDSQTQKECQSPFKSKSALKHQQASIPQISSTCQNDVRDMGL